MPSIPSYQIKRLRIVMNSGVFIIQVHWTGRRSKLWAAYHSSRAGGCSSWRICLSWFPYPFNNSKLSWYLVLHCRRHSCGYAKPRWSYLVPGQLTLPACGPHLRSESTSSLSVCHIHNCQLLAIEFFCHIRIISSSLLYQSEHSLGVPSFPWLLPVNSASEVT